MRKSIVALFAAVSVSGMIAVPAAAETAEAVSVGVSYADLDLTAPAGSAVLEQRIDAAVDKVCEKPDMRALTAMVAWEACKADARAGALDQLSVLEPYDHLALASVF